MIAGSTMMVDVAGLEPARVTPRRPTKALRIPVSPHVERSLLFARYEAGVAAPVRSPTQGQSRSQVRLIPGERGITSRRRFHGCLTRLNFGSEPTPRPDTFNGSRFNESEQIVWIIADGITRQCNVARSAFTASPTGQGARSKSQNFRGLCFREQITFFIHHPPITLSHCAPLRASSIQLCICIWRNSSGGVNF